MHSEAVKGHFAARHSCKIQWQRSRNLLQLLYFVAVRQHAAICQADCDPGGVSFGFAEVFVGLQDIIDLQPCSSDLQHSTLAQNNVPNNFVSKIVS